MYNLEKWVVMHRELIEIFEKANKRFLYENAAFIMSNVSERSFCSALAQCIYLEILGDEKSVS